MQIFGPTCTQAEFFEGTISSQVHDFLHGKNALVFSYGVTNAGKTYTIQGEFNIDICTLFIGSFHSCYFSASCDISAVVGCL